MAIKYDIGKAKVHMAGDRCVLQSSIFCIVALASVFSAMRCLYGLDTDLGMAVAMGKCRGGDSVGYSSSIMKEGDCLSRDKQSGHRSGVSSLLMPYIMMI